MTDYLASAIKVVMETDDSWRERLFLAIERSGRSERSIGVEAKCGPSYLYDVRVAGKQPTVPKLIAICKVLNVSLAYIFLGVEINPGEEELFRMFVGLRPEQRSALQNFLLAMKASEQSGSLPQAGPA
jgi:hypothetical protein